MKTLGLCVMIVAVFAPPASAQDELDIPFRMSLVAAEAGHGADLATTEYCLGARETRRVTP